MQLYEEIFLLGLNDQKGRISQDVDLEIRFLLSGAILAELALGEYITLDEKKRLVVLRSGPTGEALMDEALEQLAAASKARRPSYWIRRLADGVKRLQRRVGMQLVHRGILRREEKRYLWVIPYEAFPQQDASAKFWLKQRLRAAVLAGGPADPRTVALLGLLRACDLLDLIFTRDEIKVARKTVDTLTQTDEFARGVREAVEEIEAAAAAAASMETMG